MNKGGFMPNRIVIGSQWGDEGKAKVVDFLTHEAEIVIRFQGGANAGHTVKFGDQEFIFHLIPSGVMHEGKYSVIGNGVVLDPEQLLKELEELKEKGIVPGNNLKISENAHVVLPFHKAIDQLKEKIAGKDAIGTTGRGIGPCYSDKINRLGVRVADLLDPVALRQQIERVGEVKNREIVKLYESEALDLEKIIIQYEEFGKQLSPYVCDTSAWLYSELDKGARLLFEGAQGTILDVDHGTYPFVTSSNTTAGGACTGSGIGPTSIDQVIGVVKAYTTRVGNGPFPTELDDEKGEALGRIGHEFGATTGRKRRCGWFDTPVVRKAAQVNGLTHLAITKIDVMDTFDKVKICVAYDVDGVRHDLIPNQLLQVERAKPIYEELDGWLADTTECRNWDDLPENAKIYLNRLAELVGVKIGIVSVGPKRDQSIIADMT